MKKKFSPQKGRKGTKSKKKDNPKEIGDYDGFSKGHSEELDELFNLCRNDDSLISRFDFLKILQALGILFKEENLIEFANHIILDKEPNATWEFFSFSQYQRIVVGLSAASLRGKMKKKDSHGFESFRIFDRDGVVHLDALKRVVCSIGDKLDEHTWGRFTEEIKTFVTKDKEGEIKSDLLYKVLFPDWIETACLEEVKP